MVCSLILKLATRGQRLMVGTSFSALQADTFVHNFRIRSPPSLDIFKNPCLWDLVAQPVFNSWATKAEGHFIVSRQVLQTFAIKLSYFSESVLLNSCHPFDFGRIMPFNNLEI